MHCMRMDGRTLSWRCQRGPKGTMVTRRVRGAGSPAEDIEEDRMKQAMGSEGRRQVGQGREDTRGDH